MKNTQTNIAGYKVELDFESEGENVISQCFISSGSYSASLEHLLATGCLSDSFWEKDLKVPARVIDEIESWAQVNGY